MMGKQDNYRSTVLEWRLDHAVPRKQEMHAAGWLPQAIGKLRRDIHCPALGIVVSTAEPGALLAAHFELMGEAIPARCPSLHALDTGASRSYALASGVETPSPDAIWEKWR